MRIGKPIERSDDASVVPEKMPVSLKTKLKIAACAAVPVAAIGVTLHSAKARQQEDRVSGDNGGREEAKSGPR